MRLPRVVFIHGCPHCTWPHTATGVHRLDAEANWNRIVAECGAHTDARYQVRLQTAQPTTNTH